MILMMATAATSVSWAGSIVAMKSVVTEYSVYQDVMNWNAGVSKMNYYTLNGETAFCVQAGRAIRGAGGEIFFVSTFVNALSGLAGVTIQPSVPGFAVDMQGAIITVPMAEFGGQSDYIMTIGTNFICEKHSVPCRLLLSPDVRSLNFLLRKLGVLDE